MKMSQRSCYLLTTRDIPQAKDSKGRCTYWCSCGNFVTKHYNYLFLHVHRNHVVVYFAALFLLLLLVAVFYLQFQYDSIGILTSFFVVLCSICYEQLQSNRAESPHSESFLKLLQEKVELKEKKRKAKIRDTLKSGINYDVHNCGCLKRFSIIKERTHCIFARTSKVWGSADWDDSLSIEENVKKSLPAIVKFYTVCREEHLDGFCIEVQGQNNSDTVESLGETVRRVLTTVSDYDPNSDNSMRQEHVGRRGWRFTFNKEYTFVTCFAGCYPSNHARFDFGASKQFGSCFILLQPECSFGYHNIGQDHPWDETKSTVRQRIRHLFRDHGRRYYVPLSRYYPMAPMIVPALIQGERPPRWWVQPENKAEDEAEANSTWWCGDVEKYGQQSVLVRG